MPESLRSYLVANMFDGDEAGLHTAPATTLLDDIVFNVARYLIGESDRDDLNMSDYYTGGH